MAGHPARMEFELRRGGKLVALVSTEIAPKPDSVGVEILSREDPLPLLGLVAGLSLLRPRAAQPSGAPMGRKIPARSSEPMS